MKYEGQVFKRVLSLVMAFAMIFAIIPVSTRAADTDTVLYLVPNSNWLIDNARFAIYYWDASGTHWTDMSDSDGDGVYEGTVPAGYTNIIFCRMNPSNATNSWDTKWNQTSNLTVPTNGNNCYTVANGTWDKGGGTWSVYTPEEEEPPTTTESDVPPESSVPEEYETMTIYFENNWSWSDLRIHWWGSAYTNTEWNTQEMTYVDTTEAGYDRYMIEVPTDITGMLFNGTGGYGAEQCEDITSGWYDGICYYMTYDSTTDTKPAGSYQYAPIGWTVTFDGTNVTSNGESSVEKDGTYTATLTAADGYVLPAEITVTVAGAAAEFTYDATTGALSIPNVTGNVYIMAVGVSESGEPNPETCTVTLHFANTQKWSAVSLYVWDAAGTTLTGSWPGTALAKDADGFYSYSFTVPYATTVNFIFNDGQADNGSKTKDLTLGKITSDVERWIKEEELLSEAFVVVQSPLVNGYDVTFNYGGDEDTTSVKVFGAWDNWTNGVDLLDADGDGIFSATVTMPSYGEYEYKFVVGENWVTDPANSWTQNENSAFVVLNPDAVDNNEVTVNIHYSRADGNYDGWNLWVWNAIMDGTQFDFEDVNGEKVVSITFEDARAVLNLSLIPRYSTEDDKWADEEPTCVIDLTDVVSGTVDYYVSTKTRVLREDVVLDDKLTSAELDYDTGKIHITLAQPVTDPQFDVTNATVTEITGGGTSYVVAVGEALDLVTLYQHKVVFDGYEYTIDHNPAYASDKFAEEFTYTGTDLGANWNSNYTYFCLWAPTAEQVQLQLYATGSDAEEGAAKLGTYAMTRGEKGTWYVTVNGDLNTVYYTYLVTVNGETVEAVDPYARTTGVNGKRGMVIDLDSTDPSGWDSDVNPNPSTSYTDAIIYELHVRDFSIDSSSGIMEDYMGKFLAFTQTGTTVNGEPGGLSTGIDYLKSLGVTHVHLLPVYDYGSVDETKCENFNWGYDPVNYNVPEGSYSTDPYKGEVRVEEMKQMIQALHEAGISVIMDVVYNHVYDAGEYCYNQIVPGYFSRPSSNASGCGNDTASEREMVSKYIVESVVYWSSEYHFDGFRFDLVGLIDVDTIDTLVAAVHATRPDTIFYGEGWNMDRTNSEEGTEMAKQGNADLTPGFGYFSDSIRNQIAGSNGTSTGFVSGGGLGNLINYYLAQPESWGETWTKNPSQVVQYASCHDNHTLIDKLILSTGAIGITDDIISMNNLSAVIYMTAQGIPFIHAGEEMLREKLEEDGERCENSYNASDFVNSIKWDNLLQEEYTDTVAYYQGLIAFRKAHAALRFNNEQDVAAYVQPLEIGNNLIAFYVDGNGCDDDDIVIIFNANSTASVVDLPEGIWNVCIDDENAGTDTLYTAQVSVQVNGISAMVLTKQSDGQVGTQFVQSYDGKYYFGTYDKTADTSDDTITLYFSNNKHWSAVYAYAWSSSTSDMLGAWPGTGLTYVESNEYGEDIYKIAVPANATAIIFNDGVSEQTIDITTLADGRGYYCTEKGVSGYFINDAPYEGASQYYLYGYINGQNYACEESADAMGKYQFVDGKLIVKFAEDSYVGVKTTDNGTWYMTDGWLGSVKTATLSDSATLDSTTANKLMIPGGVTVTLTLTVNDDGTLTLSYEAEDVSASDQTGIQDGLTLQCWNWSFSEIEANLNKIADMGFTAIQTSPVQPIKQTTEGFPVSDWWVYYQPVDFVITDGLGNALGTKAELESMIEKAHSLGIKVIVDVVANHLGNETENDLSPSIPDALLGASNWHSITTNITNYKDRYDTTQYCLNGLPDLNTGSANVQQMVLSFLKDCIDIGVDGFRFDAAKHIETPDDELAYDSEFWPVVVGGARAYAKSLNQEIYVYGEVLDGTDNYAIVHYTKYMSVTDNSWGNTLRGNISSGNASISAGFDKATDASNLVLWAESHDTYADGTSSGVSTENINKVWALVAARADAMGLYFARPETDIQLLGTGSVTGWSYDEVKAVNGFHNAFVGKSETVGSSGDLAYVVRGDSGIVIVNAAGTTGSVNLQVAMADGTYVDQITGNTFTVSGGTIAGNLGDTGVAVVYNVEIIFGDANDDGEVTAYDASLIKKYSVGLVDASALNLDVCDLDGDGHIDAFDAALIQRFCVSAITKFPVEE